MKNVEKHLSLLGKKGMDKISGITGIVDSICFDLYGCIQATINQGVDVEGKQKDQRWLDVSRIEVIDNNPIMKQPNWDFGQVAEGLHGPADKPSF